MRDSSPKAIYLKDYTPPEFLIETVDLQFELDAENTRVIAQLKISRNPAAVEASHTLVLNGENLILESVKLDERVLAPADYQLDDENLCIPEVPTAFELTVITRTNPKTNTALEGLYLSNGMLCTQCEAEGFRKITYFLDRPDVMARYTTTLIANKSDFPVLLSNGNPVDQGELDHNRHWVKWEDPFKKPSYLFALVAGQLACIRDHYTTGSGRVIDLCIYVEAHDADKCAHAMASLKKAMAWDEQVYGREYDLDLYMIVAVSHFNMGAMENKGLNVFNTKFVLARPDTATDTDYEQIEAVIAHEYFHNWTGNRVTCRDWFQLSLKEGLTVFRDQSFTADQTSSAVKRIHDVNTLRTRQFPEDAGPMAHPIRPDSYMEINNFYTLTVYEKGAEVVRMIHTLLGQAGFRKGTDLYFQRHDGQAVTTDDFVRAMEDANEADLNQFRRWYSQAGTPELHAGSHYDPQQQRLTLTLRQSCPPTPNQPDKQALHMPVAIGLLKPDGGEYPLEQSVLQLTETEQSFQFDGLDKKPVVSLLRGFSAPVKLRITRDAEELTFLFRHDSDPFNRWEAGQQLMSGFILQHIQDLQQQAPQPLDTSIVDACRHCLQQTEGDLSYRALLLTLPSETYLGEQMAVVDVEAIHTARQHLRRTLAEHLQPLFEQHYQHLQKHESGDLSTVAIGQRRFKNTCLAYLSALETTDCHTLCQQQFEQAHTMTDQIAALSAIVNSQNPSRSECLEAFYQQWQDEDLVIDKWFALQASSCLPETLQKVQHLLQHKAFSLGTPNRVRALIGAFAQSNPVRFHAADGSGYQFLGDRIVELNALNPQVASRMLAPLTQWRRYDTARQNLMKTQLQRIASLKEVSRDVYEIASKSIS